MVTLVSLWLPIVLAAVMVFVASFVINMALPYHRSDLRKLEREDEVMEALRKFVIPPGDYAVPRASSMAEMGKPEFVSKLKAGPVMYMTVEPNGPARMGASLFLWFLNSLAVSVIAAYIAGRALPVGAHYLQVFRFAGCVAFTGYSLALLQQSIWFGRSWWTTAKFMFDGLVYGLLTAGVFGWLWPR
jgi:hypothetical protein